MEGKSSASSSLMLDGMCGFLLDPQGSMQVTHNQAPHPHQSFVVHPQQIQDVFPFRVRKMQESDQPVLFLDCNNNGETAKNSANGDDRENAAEVGLDGHNEGGEERKESPWKRVKWTDKMCELLITAVSYTGEGAVSDFNGGGRKNSVLFGKRGKWRAISKVMVERGFHVSPQQCEDKFNDLNKKYKRLQDLLGRGTSCKVVENPGLLDYMDLSCKAKEDVRKILSSKQLFYRELCSYHNGNRLYLPHDWALQQAMLLALKGYRKRPYELDVIEGGVECNDDTEEAYDSHEGNGQASLFPGFSNDHADANHVFTEGGEGEQLQGRWMSSRSLQLEVQKLQIQAQMLELEKQRLKWMSFSQQENGKLDRMRLENERLKLENVRLALELNRRERIAYSN